MLYLNYINEIMVICDSSREVMLFIEKRASSSTEQRKQLNDSYSTTLLRPNTSMDTLNKNHVGAPYLPEVNLEALKTSNSTQ